jgi:glycosyltransferase involved in cell wall biosynthesis
MNFGVSIIVGFKNRDLLRIKNSLDSIFQQTNLSFEVIFIDYGSDEVISTGAKNLVNSYPFTKYIYAHTNGWFWNRAHALNIGFKHAKNDIILYYDIDLILESTFIEKVLLLDYSTKFYTFSCFYLPVNFEISPHTLKNNAIHLEQNYVGLCAVSKIALNTIQAFDEFYFVWGVEDDDIYRRLVASGISHIQFNANQFNVFHQWHLIQAPQKPSLWYLTMLTYFFQKENIHTGQMNMGYCTSVSDRKLLIVDQTSVAINKISFGVDGSLLYFNSFIQSFYQMKSGEIAHVEYVEKDSDVVKLPWYVMCFSKKERAKEIINQTVIKNDILSFFNYFVGINRHRIDDYNLKIDNNSISILILAK